MIKYTLRTALDEVIDHKDVLVEVEETKSVVSRKLLSIKALDTRINGIDLSIAELNKEKTKLQGIRSKVLLEANKVATAINKK